MAEPPNALTRLIFSQGTASGIYDALAVHNCLTPQALADRDAAMSVIASSITAHASRDQDAGATMWYAVVLALLEAGFLNDHARQRLKAPRTSSSIPARARATLEELWWRVRY
jgi:hypothetical protein